MVLNKRIKRDLKDNLIRSVAMFFIIALTMALVVSLCSSTDCIHLTIKNEWNMCNIEDGGFEVYIPLSKRNMKDLSELDVNIEKMFYTDTATNQATTLRIFSNRQTINLAFVDDGKIPSDSNEIFIEKLYAKNHDLSVGSYVEIDGNIYTVCGIGTLPDYCYVKQNNGDVSSDIDFGVGTVTNDSFNKISAGKKIIYNYAYKLGENTTEVDLKNKLVKLKFDYNAVKDTYIKGKINTASNIKESFVDATDKLKSGTLSLENGIDEFDKSLNSIGINADYCDDLSTGANSVYLGIQALQSEFSKYIDESNKYDIINLSSFESREYNTRINDALDDSAISKRCALIIGIFMFILLIYMLAMFATGTVEKERAVIGTLYALGYTKQEILHHYMVIPLIIAASGGLIGTAAGFLLTDTMADSSLSIYSVPNLIRIFPMYLLLYGIGVPIIFSYFINRLVLSKKLNLTPLKMMRGEIKQSKHSSLNLNRLSFATKYKIRQFIREIKGNITLFVGIFISILLMMFSFGCYGSITAYINSITDDVHYNYMYLLRNPVTDLPKDSCIGYTRGFNVDYPMTGGEMEVSLQGIDYDNPYFEFAQKLSDEENKIYASNSAVIKFGYKPGDAVVLKDSAEDKFYTFEIEDIVDYGSGLYFFMNINAMRKSFGESYYDKDDFEDYEKEPDSSNYYYNTVFSDNSIKFKHNMVISEIETVTIVDSAKKLLTLMFDMIVMLIAVSVIIFIAVLYLLMKMEIDRSSFSISLLKALGYSKKEVNSFYIGSSFYVMLLDLILGIPICKIIMNHLWPYCVSNVNAGFKCTMTPPLYCAIAVIVATAYFITLFLLKKHLDKISMTEILKNRE